MTGGTVPRINGERLWADLMALGEIGFAPGRGVTRTALSQADLAGKDWLAGRFREAGLEVRTDAAYNVIGRLGSGTSGARLVAMGSHLDTVPQGGKFDGMLGVLEPFFLGVPISVANVGVLGIKYPAGSNGAAVYGWNNDVTNAGNYGGLFCANGASQGINYGVYSVAKSAAANYAGRYFGRMEIDGHSGSSDGADYFATVLKVDVNHTAQVDTRAIDAVSKPADGYGYGVYATGGYMGVFGIAQAGAYNNLAYGVYGSASGTAGVRIGVYGSASGGETNWAGYFNGHTYVSSDLRIATTYQAAGYALSVNGKIACEEVLVQDLDNWPDYVFDEDYYLRPLADVEADIQRDHHLPGLPSASEIENDGLSLGEMQKKLLEKIEELTLYAIRQEKTIEKMQAEIESLKVENHKLMGNAR